MFLNREILKGICTFTLLNMKTASIFIKLLYIKIFFEFILIID